METLEIYRCALWFGVLIFLVGAVTLDLYFLFRFSGRKRQRTLPGISYLKKHKITLPVVALTLLTALFFTVPNQINGSATGDLPLLSNIILGSLVYLLAALLLLFFAAYQEKTGVAAFFHAPGGSIRAAALKGLVYGIAAIPPTMFTAVLSNNLIARAGFEIESQPVIEWLTAPDTATGTRFAIFISAVIFAPLAEELIFRGILFPAVLRNNSWIFSAMLTGCIFSLIHFHPPSFLSIFTLSFCFCAGYSVTGSLITPIVMHMVFNGIATLFTLLA